MNRPTRISFYLGKDGMPAWLIQAIYHQVSQFTSQVTLVQCQSQRSVDIKQYLNIMSMAFQPYELCQLQIHQPKSNQLEQELCAYLAKYTQVIYPTVSAIHLLEVEALMQRLSVDFDWTFLKPNKKLAEFKTLMRKADPQADLAQRQYAIKEFLLQQIAQAAPTENPALLKEQLRARELRSATTMKSGVALPHTISSAVEKPALVAIALDENIDWGGVFGPVSHIIAMLLPANPQPFHTSAFRALSLSFLNHKTGEFICEHKTSEELHAILHCLMKVPKNPINHQPLSIKLS